MSGWRMADAEGRKILRDFSSCGFDSHPGHQLGSNKTFDIVISILTCSGLLIFAICDEPQFADGLTISLQYVRSSHEP